MKEESRKQQMQAHVTRNNDEITASTALALDFFKHDRTGDRAVIKYSVSFIYWN